MRSLALTLLSVLLTGCAITSTAPPLASTGAGIQGKVHGGQQPITGAHVYLLAANTTGYGGNGLAATSSNASISLLNPSTTGLSDALGAYVLTDANGNFTITGDYLCTQGQQVYLYALGGNPGAVTNSAAALLAILGTCPASGDLSTSIPFVFMDEVTTVAAAYAFAGFATDATHVSSSGTPLAQNGITNAFANAANLVNLSTGNALATTPAGNGTVPQATINTLANILAACVNSTGPSSTPCSTLLSHSTADGNSAGVPPTDTASSAINTAHYPGLNLSALFGLQTPEAPFAPALSAEPNDFTIGLNFSGGGLSFPVSVAIDSSGNAWIADDSLIELSSSGSFLSGSSGFPVGNGGGVVAVDQSNNVWLTDSGLIKVSSLGAVVSRQALSGLDGIAIDGAGDEWVGNDLANSVTGFTSAGVFLPGEPSNGYSAGNTPNAVAIDGSGNLWIANAGSGGSIQGTLSEVSDLGVPISPVGIGSTAGGITHPLYIAIDSAGSAWFTNIESGGVFKVSHSGIALSPSNGFDDNAPRGFSSQSLAIDGAGTVWIANSAVDAFRGSVSALSNSGAVLTPGSGFTGGAINNPATIAVDGSGNIWTGNFASKGSSITELIGIATPVITPIAAGLPATPTTDGSSLLGTRP